MKIYDIKFERIWMDFLVDAVPEKIIFAVTKTKKDGVLTVKNEVACDNLDIIESADGKTILRFNITCINNRKFLPYGIWSIYKNEVEPKNLIEVDEAAIDAIFNLAKIYYYSAYWRSYNISFKFLFENNKPYLQILTAFSDINHGKKKSYKLKTRLKKCLYATANRLYRILNVVAKKDAVLFFSDTYDHLTPQLQIVLDTYERHADKPYRSHTINFVLAKNLRNSIGSILKTLYWVARAKYLFIDNYSFTLNQLNLSRRTKLVQLWHANEGFKSVGYSRFGMEGSPGEYASVYKTTYKALAPSPMQTAIYEEVFGIEKSAFLPWGRPEITGLGDPEKTKRVAEELYAKYPVLAGKEIVLFAPTYRGKNHSSGFYYNFDWLDLDKVYAALSAGQIFAIKLHGYIRNSADLVLPDAYKDKIIVLPPQTNINDIYLITDVLITDYSSAYSDFAFLKKPILFYTPDRLEYQYVRGVNHVVADYAPGKVCDTLDSLLVALQRKDFNLQKTIDYSDSMYHEYTGNVAIKLVDWLIDDDKREQFIRGKTV